MNLDELESALRHELGRIRTFAMSAELAYEAHWPWGPDPESAAPIYMHYVSARQARTTAPAHQTG